MKVELTAALEVVELLDPEEAVAWALAAAAGVVVGNIELMLIGSPDLISINRCSC